MLISKAGIDIKIMQVPGFTHPVTDMYLEDILRLTGYQDALLGGSGRASRLANGHSKSQHAGGLSPISSSDMSDWELLCCSFRHLQVY